MYYIKLYITAIIVFTLIDALWLGVIAKNLYKSTIGHLMAEKVNWFAAAIFYLIYIVGIVVFALHPAIESQNLSLALTSGGLFGFFCYATYDLTNQATLKNWPIKVTILDLIWGSFITASTSGISYYLITNFLI